MILGPVGERLIQGFEALRLEPYDDADGATLSYPLKPLGNLLFRKDGSPPIGHPTIGWGHKIGFTEFFAVPITREVAEALFDADVATAVRAVSQIHGLHQIRFDVLASLAYNIGAGAFAGSAIVEHAKAGRIEMVPAILAQWRITRRRVSLGLVRRRALEALLWCEAERGEAWALAVMDSYFQNKVG